MNLPPPVTTEPTSTPTKTATTSSTSSGSGGGGGSTYMPSSGSKLNFTELIALARRAGFSKSQSVVMASIAMAESGGRVNIPSPPNHDGSIDYGLWQINSSHGLDTHRLLTDPLYNARMAYKVFKEQGLHAWSTYNSGAFRQYLGQSEAAAPNVSHVDIQQVIGRNYAAGNGGGGDGAAPGNAQFSQQDVNDAISNLGLPKALINSNASLKKAFQQIVSRQIDDPARIEEIFKKTAWWQNHSAAQRSFATLRYDDPAEWERQLGQKKHDIQQVAGQMGVQLSDGDLNHLATLTLRNGLDDNETQRAIAGHFEYQKGHAYTGQAGVDIDSLQKTAADYYTRIDPKRIDSMVTRMLAGGLDPSAVTDYFKQQALSRFPNLSKQLNAGMTVGDIASPYVNAMSQLLEVAPTSVKANDPTVMKALQHPKQDGSGFDLMPEWQFEETLRNDPRWLKTDNAQQTLLGIGHDLLKTWGVAT